ncbi:hypothetical protein QE152_g9853 [Popillia japonica]|uniref:Uncharacterized protein n=1 Tax=Popillia japonica TaxID=7064 RepID=A0AAW1LWN4_POPJA
MALIIRVICVKSKSNDLHEKIVSGFTCHPSKYPYLISVVIAVEPRRRPCMRDYQNESNMFKLLKCQIN